MEYQHRKKMDSGLTSRIANSPDYYIVHSYFIPYNQPTNASDILERGPVETKKVMDFVKQTLQNGGLLKSLTEWNIFANGDKATGFAC
jgi:hypothetical protein